MLATPTTEPASIVVGEASLDHLLGLDDDDSERVREAFEAAESGAEITLLSDRNPTPVADFPADVAGVTTPRDALAEFAVQRRGADWLARFRKPTA
ncbi:MAG: hypothetical protein ABEH35_00510 [Haloarculaceae archaeon]